MKFKSRAIIGRVDQVTGVYYIVHMPTANFQMMVEKFEMSLKEVSDLMDEGLDWVSRALESLCGEMMGLVTKAGFHSKAD